jgi:hypothetical protein
VKPIPSWRIQRLMEADQRRKRTRLIARWIISR